MQHAMNARLLLFLSPAAEHVPVLKSTATSSVPMGDRLASMTKSTSSTGREEIHNEDGGA